VILSVSTVKDTVPNLRRFVRRNLGNGIDHMVVFVDSDDPVAESFLSAHPNVTCIRTGDDWWRGKRPAHLNVRQNTNANVAKAALTRFAWAEWLFHVDSDEVVLVDKDRLAEVDDDVRVVRLRPHEAVSHRKPRRDNLFKRPLTAEELHLLALLDVIRVPDNKAYFHGHVAGKSGFRPSLDLTAGIHRPIGPAGERQTALEGEWLRLLHFDSLSSEEFVRKWRNLRSSGPRPKVRKSRAHLMMALDALSAADLPPRAQSKYLMRLYERTTEDDVGTLLELGLLEEIDPDIHRFEPHSPGDADKAALEKLLGGLAAVDKEVFRKGAPAEVEAVLARGD